MQLVCLTGDFRLRQRKNTHLGLPQKTTVACNDSKNDLYTGYRSDGRGIVKEVPSQDGAGGFRSSTQLARGGSFGLLSSNLLVFEDDVSVGSLAMKG